MTTTAPAALTQFYLKTSDQIRDDMLRTYAAMLVRRGILNPNVSQGTEIYVKYSAIANQLAVASSNTQLTANAVMPDSAQGTDLSRVAAIYGLSLRAAGGSSGFIALAASVPSAILIPTGSQLLDPNGLKYQVNPGGSFSNGQQIRVQAVDTGSATNLAAGIVLKWSSPPPFVSQAAMVATGGFTGGADTETFEGLRTRLLAYFANPPAAGNWSQINATAEGSSVAVQKAFTYAAANGPSSVHVAVTSAPTATNKNRNVDTVITIPTVVTPAVYALLPEYVELVLTTVQNQTANVSVALSLPASPAAMPAGPGGGWTDGQPWPTFASQGYANVTAVTNTQQITVNADLPPVAGVTNISWFSPIEWKLYTAVVTAFGGSGPYVINLNVPFPNIAVGHVISPLALNSQNYFNAFLNMFANMGPGQKTNVSGVLPRAYRKPLVGQNWPSDLVSQNLKFFINSGNEVADAIYLYRSVTTPTIPASISQGPWILVPGNLSIYPM